MVTNLFLDFGQRLGKNFGDFKDDYDLDNNLSKSYSGQIIFKNALNALREIISDCSVRETKKTAGIELPGKKFVVEYVDLEKNNRSCIQNYKKNCMHQ